MNHLLRPILAVTFVLCSSLSVLAQSRVTTSFDKDWLFLKSDAQGAEQPNFADSSWRKLDVPHDWSIEGPFSKDNPTGGAGGFLPAGVGWYRKHFKFSECQPPISKTDCLELRKEERLFIEFDGVMSNSEVWINGQYLGKRPYGYVSFSYELTGKLNLDGSDNVISVKVDTSQQPASRWYTGAGIYRHVRLIGTSSIYIPYGGMFITTPKVNKREATVNVSSEVINTSDKAREVRFYVTLYDPKGKEVGSKILVIPIRTSYLPG